MVRPLYAKTKKECLGKWEWGDKEEQAGDELRTKLTRGNPKPIRVLTDHKNLVTFMTMKEQNEPQARWMQGLSQYNFKIEYGPGKEGGKPDVLTRRKGDLPTAGDKRLTRNVGILFPRELYWDIPEAVEIKLDLLEPTEFQDKDEGEI